MAMVQVKFRVTKLTVTYSRRHITIAFTVSDSKHLPYVNYFQSLKFQKNPSPRIPAPNAFPPLCLTYLMGYAIQVVYV